MSKKHRIASISKEIRLEQHFKEYAVEELQWIHKELLEKVKRNISQYGVWIPLNQYQTPKFKNILIKDLDLNNGDYGVELSEEEYFPVAYKCPLLASIEIDDLHFDLDCSHVCI